MDAGTNSGGAIPHWMKLFSLVLPGAHQGNADAQWEAGELWLHFGGATELALYWYRQAARQGHEVAAYSLAVYHFHARGLYRDPEEALYWCYIASIGGNERAGRLYPVIRGAVSQRLADRVAARLCRDKW